MSRRSISLMMRYLALLLITAVLAMAEPANMSGTWILNEKRSRFGNNPRPGNVVLSIQHQEPKLRYSGTTSQPDEGNIIDFHFDGAIDGKPYVVKEDRGDRTITFRRVNDRVVESDSRWSDGDLHSMITMSGDGRTMERKMSFKDRLGKRREWVEVYEKKQ
jgi:hypothetical protein